jgi:hypothetical protein
MDGAYPPLRERDRRSEILNRKGFTDDGGDVIVRDTGERLAASMIGGPPMNFAGAPAVGRPPAASPAASPAGGSPPPARDSAEPADAPVEEDDGDQEQPGTSQEAATVLPTGLPADVDGDPFG